MLIAVDLDEVLADLVSSFVEFHNRRTGTALRREQFLSYEWEDPLNAPLEIVVQRLHEFAKAGGFLKVKAVPGSIDGIDTLRGNNRLAVVTSRLPEFVPDTLQWLSHNFPGKFEDVHFSCNVYTKTGGSTKHAICKKLGAKVLIEDDIGYAVACASAGIEVILLDCPWNQGQLPPGIIRVSSWQQIPQEIQKIQKLSQST